MSVQAILIFFLFLGPLIFFHELGHFLFARFFGVKVETFSIGFGPKILKFKRGDTEYVLSLIPLGGYVKMFGDDPLKKDDIAEEDRDKSFNFKSKFARFWIVMGGPLANFLMAFVIFTLLSLSGEKIPEMRLGKIEKDAELYSYGIRTGDVLNKVNNKKIYNPSDVLGDSSGLVNTVTVGRDGKFQQLILNIKGKTFFENVIKHPPMLLAPLVYDKAGNAYYISSEKTLNFYNSLEQFEEKRFSFLYLFKVKNLDSATDLKKLDYEKEPIELSPNYNTDNLLQVLRNNGYFASDVRVQKVKGGSAASKAGIIEGDILLKINSKEFFTFDGLRNNLQKTTGDSVSITILRKGIEKDLNMSPVMEKIEGKVVKLIGVYSDAKATPLNFVNTKSLGLLGAVSSGAIRCYEAVLKTIDGFYKLISGQVSLKNIGGPVTIGKVASDSFNISLSYFFQIMAMISVNLGVINLFPIPVLDGGHILFLVLEAINGGPLSRRKMEIAQMVGLSFILLLMTGAIFNDFSRWF